MQNHSIGAKIRRLLLRIVMGAILLTGAAGFINMHALKRMAQETNQYLGEVSAANAETALEEVSKEQLIGVAEEKAAFIDEKFREVESCVKGLAALTTEIYAHPEKYPDRHVSEPVPGSSELAAQLLWSQHADRDAAQEELRKLANVQDLLVQYNANNTMISSCYVASVTGFMIQADYIAFSKYGQDSAVPLPYEAESRQWYQRAAASTDMDIIYTDIIEDIHEGGDGIVCAKAVRSQENGELLAVVGIGSYLDSIRRVVLNTEIGQTGYAFLMNEKGQIIASAKTEGDTVAYARAGLRFASSSRQAEEITGKMCAGEKGITTLKIDGRQVFLAYAPLEHTGWSFAVVMDIEEVLAPATESYRFILTSAKGLEKTQNAAIRRTVWVLLGILFATGFMSMLFGSVFARRLTAPIVQLTNDVSRIGAGNLDYRIQIHTGDEVEALGNAFNHMTEKMREYIRNLAEATAERERIHAEIGLAARIQADMLPKVDEPFKSRTELRLLAGMTPAKGVGGDFYDFFFLDDMHLAMVMADVSGKGMAAALFMVEARTVLRSRITTDRPLAQIAETVNNILCENNENGMFVTAWIGILTLPTGRLRCVNAGHCYPLIRHGDGTAEYLEHIDGMVLAGMEDIPYTQQEYHLRQGDAVLLYTDGVTEDANESGELYGEQRLKACVENSVQDLEGMLDDIKRELKEYQGSAPQADDITMLAVQWDGYRYDRYVFSPQEMKIADIVDFAENSLNGAGIAFEDSVVIQVAVDEIASNICYYSGAGSASLGICVSDRENRREVILYFADDGVPYNPLEQANPDVDKDLRERKAGGLGIFMVKEQMDSVFYEYSEGQNQLVCTYKLHSSSEYAKINSDNAL